MKKTACYILYNVIICALLFLLSEIIIGTFFPQVQLQGISRSIFRDSLYFDSPGLYPLSSGYTNGIPLNVDRFGFRRTGVTIDTSKAGWLFLGDSVTMGLGVDADSTFSAILQRKYPEMNILNPSMIGYSLKAYENLFRYFIQRRDLKIKKVSIFWCLNDIYMGNIDQTDEPGGNVRAFCGKALEWIRMHSRLYTVLKNVCFNRAETYFKFDEKFYINENDTLFCKAINVIESIAGAAGKEKIDFNVYLLPYEYQLRNSHCCLPQKNMIHCLAGKEIEVCDIISLLPKTVHPEKLYLYGDGIHFSNTGHRVIAQLLSASPRVNKY